MVDSYSGDIGVGVDFTTHFFDSVGKQVAISSKFNGTVLQGTQSFNKYPTQVPPLNQMTLLAYMQVIHDVVLELECISNLNTKLPIPIAGQVDVRYP